MCTRASLAPKSLVSSIDHTDHILINVPLKGATYLQDAMARRLAGEVGADLIIIDNQDFIRLAKADQGAFTVLPMMTSASNRSKSYLTVMQNPLDKAIKQSEEEKSENEDHLSTEGALEAIKNALWKRNEKVWAVPKEDIDTEDSTQEESKGSEEHVKMVSKIMTEFQNRATSLFQQSHSKLEAPKIVYLRDYLDMNEPFVAIMLAALLVAVDDLREKRHRVMFLAGHSISLQQRMDPDTDMDNLLMGKNLPLMAGMRGFTVLPPANDFEKMTLWNTQLKIDEAKRIGEINARHILDIHGHKQVTGLQSLQGTIPELIKALSGLEGITKEVWPMEDVDRRVTTAIGSALAQKKEIVELEDFRKAHMIIQKSVTLQGKVAKLMKRQKARTQNDGQIDLVDLKEQCDEYESRLVSRIVDPSKVQCTFKDVRAPPLTIETLQTLISLPLVRPDLFQHGILKRNFISGVLLFGPPGTGKTMLAKAVAKESGSRMLEIQSSDIYDMYVGEGEKNVKAIFSLARKLAPCVVFIDEVDSIMRKRRSDTNSGLHREIINQFMVEWDGLSSDNQGVMVMAATNRPFDLDDAVLRRMPRRVLVDLPKEDDRADILRMLLQDEQHDVSLAELAKRTEHYSGSDLKNMCVTAALKAVQQEVLTKEKQVLGWSHFEEALKMVPASSSEKMESVVEIREWAAVYGDGDKKKKRPNIGFA
ncbi:P-loop containing nucleoside triphosphate hydrolase protein [Phycomyces blakesleeanus]